MPRERYVKIMTQCSVRGVRTLSLLGDRFGCPQQSRNALPADQISLRPRRGSGSPHRPTVGFFYTHSFFRPPVPHSRGWF